MKRDIYITWLKTKKLKNSVVLSQNYEDAAKCRDAEVVFIRFWAKHYLNYGEKYLNSNMRDWVELTPVDMTNTFGSIDDSEIESNEMASMMSIEFFRKNLHLTFLSDDIVRDKIINDILC